MSSGTWIPESQRDTRWYIFKRKFLCRVPFLQTMSTDFVKEFGVPAIGDPHYDAQMANEEVQRMLTINDMVEFYKQGTTVGVCNHKDTALIYEYITNHLLFWKQQLEGGSFNVRHAPIDDLLLLDQFATAVHKHARHQFTREFVDSLIARQMSNALRVNRQNILAPETPPEVINKIDTPEQAEEDPEAQFPQRASMADAFVKNRDLSMGMRKWR